MSLAKIDPVLVHEFEIHCEPERFTSFRIFLVQEGVRVSSASQLVPKALRELIQSQSQSSSADRDFVDFLNQSSQQYPIYLHTSAGVVQTLWDPDGRASSKTELDLVGGDRVRAQRIVGYKNDPSDQIRNFVRVGERLIGDLDRGRLLILTDVSGWYVADVLQEASQAVEPTKGETLLYEPENDADAQDSFSTDNYRSVIQRKSNAPDRAENFAALESSEISALFLNDRKVGYPADQRGSYLKDLMFRVNGQPAQAREGALSFRVTLARNAEKTMLRLKAATLWEGQWFDFAESFYKHFEHLNYLRSAVLKKRAVKRSMAEAALRLLFETEAGIVDKTIELEIAKLNLLNDEARWEAEEFLRRFHKFFVAHQTEHILAAKDTWCTVPVAIQKLGRLFMEVQHLFGGDLLSWILTQEKEILTEELFSKIRPLHAALTAHGIQMYYQQKPVQKSFLKTRILSNPDAQMNWFEIHPEISWDGRVLSESEWRSILENQGIWEPGEGLWILDDVSMQTLVMLKQLVSRPVKAKDMTEGKIRIPRLHFLDWIHLRQWGAEVSLSDENERLMRRLLRFEKMDVKEVPGKFRGQLRDYQKEGYDWLAFLYEHHLGGCLADDMGLGKTVQVIAFLGGLHENKIKRDKPVRGKVHLVVVPTTIVFNWRQEFKNFYPDLNVHEYGEGASDDLEKADILLTTYEMLRRDEKFFQKKQFHTVVFDEAQLVKNISAKRTLSARKLQSEFVITLTGTPLENHLGEFYSILDLSLPGLLGSYDQLRREGFSDPLQKLKRRATPFVLRRTKEKTLKELPPKSENEVYLRMSAKQRALYQKVVSKVSRVVDKAFLQKPAAQACLTALTAILRLRQVCVSPGLVDKKIRERSPKLEFLLSKLREVVDEDHSALVFSQFTSFLDVVEEGVRAEGLDYYRMDGTTPKAKRKEFVDAFQCGAGAPIFLVSLKTGGVGLNLTRASYVFHLDPWWNPAVENQASDRVHRIGQKKNVFVTRLLMEHSIEEKMMFLKKKKSRLYQEVLDGSLPKSGKMGLLSKEDFDFLLK